MYQGILKCSLEQLVSVYETDVVHVLLNAGFILQDWWF